MVNSKGLEYLGITKQSPDPSGGKIERDKNTGQPNGVLHETAMLGLSIESTNKEFVALNADKQMEAIREGAKEYAQMVVLSENPLSTSPASWSDKLRVEMTIVGGDIVYENS